MSQLQTAMKTCQYPTMKAGLIRNKDSGKKKTKPPSNTMWEIWKNFERFIHWIDNTLYYVEGCNRKNRKLNHPKSEKLSKEISLI